MDATGDQIFCRRQIRWNQRQLWLFSSRIRHLCLSSLKKVTSKTKIIIHEANNWACHAFLMSLTSFSKEVWGFSAKMLSTFAVTIDKSDEPKVNIWIIEGSLSALLNMMMSWTTNWKPASIFPSIPVIMVIQGMEI